MTTKSEQKTLVTFLLDRTGSMQSIKDDTIGAFNAYVEGLQAEDNIEFTLVQFDSHSIDKVCVRCPIAKAPKLTKDNYEPRAMTPLIDAAYKTIKAVEKSLNGETPKVVICIHTDGQENSSTEHTIAELNALIKEKTALGWQFNFMGEGIDNYATGAAMGIAMASTVSNSLDPLSRTTSYRNLARNTAMYASGAVQDTSFSAADKFGAGDKFDPTTATVPTPAPAKTKTTAKTKAVDDFAL